MKLKRSSGFSMAESMIALTILSLVMTAVMTSSLMLHRTFASIEESSDVGRQMRSFDRFFSDDARGAVSFTRVNNRKISFVHPDGSTRSYQLSAQPDGSFRIERVVGASVVAVLRSVQSWTVTAPTATNPLEIVLAIERIDGRGDRTYQTVSRSVNLRGIPP